jgi:hypothetical protein
MERRSFMAPPVRRHCWPRQGRPAQARRPDAAADAFVSVKTAAFRARRPALLVAGTNFWYGGYLGAPSAAGQRARLLKELDRLQALGINNLRVLAVSEKTAMKSAVSPATTSAPGKYDEDLLRRPGLPDGRTGQARHDGRALPEQLLAVVGRHDPVPELVPRHAGARSQRQPATTSASCARTRASIRNARRPGRVPARHRQDRQARQHRHRQAVLATTRPS